MFRVLQKQFSDQETRFLFAVHRELVQMQDFTGAKPNIDTLGVENTKLRAGIKELEAKNAALDTEIDKILTQNNIFERDLMLFDPPNKK